MPTTQDKIAEYLHEAHAMELALVRTLEAHSAMTPPGPYRDALDRHLRETRDHADRIARRLADLGRSETPLETGKGIAQRVVGQLLALGKAPLDILRGSSHEEKLLENAKDECATEALEIATYDALETLARAGGDELTARLAADHRADEERMLEALRAELPRLTAAVVGAQVPPDPAAAARPAPAARAPSPVRAVPAPRPAPAARGPRPAPRPTTATPASRTPPPAPPSPTAARSPPTERRVAAAATAPPPARRPAPAARAPSAPAAKPTPAARAPPLARRPTPAATTPPPARRAAARRSAARASRRPAAARSPTAGAGAIR